MNIFNKKNTVKWLLSAGSGFVPITNFPAFTSYTSSSSLAPFINNLYTYAIGIAAILAVIEIIWGGFLWMGSGASVSNKEAGRNKIVMSIFGLVLVLSPYLILSILNPNMLNLKLDTNSMRINQSKKYVSTQKLNTTGTLTTTPSPPPPDPFCVSEQSYTVKGGCSNKWLQSKMKKTGYLHCEVLQKKDVNMYGWPDVCLYNKATYVPKTKINTADVTQKQKDECANIIGSLWSHPIQRASSQVEKIDGGCSSSKAAKQFGFGAGGKYVCKNLTSPPKNYVCIYTKTSNSTQNKTPAPSTTSTTLTFIASPTSIAPGGSTTLTWTSTNLTSCVAMGSWSGTKPTHGSQTINNLTQSGNYTLSCTGTGGSFSRVIGVTVK